MVSIIIPAYNVENYIGECLKSVLCQTYSDIEVVVVDDGSTDGTNAVARAVADKDSRVRIIRQENMGLSGARNSGIDVAKGEWLLFVDGDDFLSEDAIKSLLALAESTQADIVCGNYTRNLPFKQPGKIVEKIFSGEDAILDVLYQRNIEPSFCAKLFKRRLFSEGRFRGGILYEDLDFFYKIFKKATRISYTDRVVYYYRRTPGSILHKFNSGRMDVLGVTERIELWASSQTAEIQKAARDRRLSANFNILGLIAANKATAEFGAEADGCWRLIKEYRLSSLLNPRVRMKNKAGILMSYLGRRCLTALLAMHYKS